MKIKKIRAKSFGEALTLVRKELGEDAVILSSEDKKGSKSYVEVTAAVDYDVEANNEPVYSKATIVEDSVNVEESGILELKSEIKDLRESIEAMKNTGFELKLSEEMKKMFGFLKDRSIKEEFALKLVEKASDIEDLESLISDDIDNSIAENDVLTESGKTGVEKSKKIVMLIGPTGVGKTTTVAKLASKAVKDGKRAAMISIDTYKIGAAEQIRIYSRMIGIPLDIVSSLESLKKSIDRFSDRDIIFIDTAGKNPGDNQYIEGLNEVYKTGFQIETQLLLSTSSDCDFLMDTHKYYKSLPIDKLAFTKTDEAVKLGSIYNLCRLYKKPVAYITTGQRVPGNIEFVDSRKLTNLILRTGCA